MQNNEQKVRSGKKARGSVRNADRLADFSERGAGGAGDWGACNSERLQAVVVAITLLGGAITFGLSRDQGSHSLTLLLDGTRKTLWFNGGANLDDELDHVVATLQAMH